MRKIVLILLSCSLVFLLFSTCKKNEFKHLDCSKLDSKYSSSIKGIIDANCNTAGCHNGSSSQSNLTTYANLKPYLDNGQFNDQVIKNKTMPQGKSLTQDERNRIKCWLDSGAPNN